MRVEAPPSASSSSDVSLGERSARSQKQADPVSVEGFSQFLAKVFDQLSLSSWLPAITLVLNAAVLVQLQSLEEGQSPGQAVAQLVAQGFGLLVVLVFAVVVTAIVAQAFEFEVIRILEGYVDSTLPIVRRLLDARIRAHLKKQGELERLERETTLKAFRNARPKVAATYADRGVRSRHLDVIEAQLAGEVLEEQKRKVLLVAASLDWSDCMCAEDSHALDALTARLSQYPDRHRTMPTRLGNVIRSYEDSLPLSDGEDIEGFVIRSADALPASIYREQRDYRTRLDMYCTLVLVFLSLAALSSGLGFGSDALLPWLIASTGYLGLALAAYEAAVASARGYGQALLEIGRIRSPRDSTAAQVSSGAEPVG